MGEVGSAYAATRRRMTELLRGADPTVVVPACPEWTGKDVAAHVTGVVDDVLAGRLDGVATEPWTALQVKTRADDTLDEILDEWTEKAPAFEDLLDNVGPAGEQAVYDVTSHEHDVRGALGQYGAHDSDGVRIGLRWGAAMFVAVVQEAGHPPLQVRTTSGQAWPADDGDRAVVEGSDFELFRSVAVAAATSCAPSPGASTPSPTSPPSSGAPSPRRPTTSSTTEQKPHPSPRDVRGV
jgi:uncharacterized protein (TIGR03083 family)